MLTKGDSYANIVHSYKTRTNGGSMLWIYVLAGIAALFYGNVGFKVGIDVGKKCRDEFNGFCVGLIAGVIWPVLLFTLWSKPKLAENKVKELPSGTENADSPVDAAEKLLLLQEKRAQLEQGVSELGKQIDELKADPEINKVLRLPKRL